MIIIQGENENDYHSHQKFFTFKFCFSKNFK
nr:MAG TPA: hypothetical protein [Caudoviricetes sp.]